MVKSYLIILILKNKFLDEIELYKKLVKNFLNLFRNCCEKEKVNYVVYFFFLKLKIENGVRKILRFYFYLILIMNKINKIKSFIIRYWKYGFVYFKNVFYCLFEVM